MNIFSSNGYLRSAQAQTLNAEGFINFVINPISAGTQDPQGPPGNNNNNPQGPQGPLGSPGAPVLILLHYMSIEHPV